MLKKHVDATLTNYYVYLDLRNIMLKGGLLDRVDEKIST